MLEIPIIRLVSAPIVGGVIGYITNSLAIRMLFRPHYKKRMFGKRIPFTSGIIPKDCQDHIRKYIELLNIHKFI